MLHTGDVIGSTNIRIRCGSGVAVQHSKFLSVWIVRIIEGGFVGACRMCTRLSDRADKFVTLETQPVSSVHKIIDSSGSHSTVFHMQ